MAHYRIVPERSRTWIDARSSLHPIHTETSGLEGWLDLEVQGGGRVNLTITPTGHLELPVDRLTSGNPLEDRELRRRIDSRRFPTIAGDLTVMNADDRDSEYVVTGSLTFRGVTRTYKDRMKVELLDPTTIRLTGQSAFDVRDFGMEPPRILMLRVEPEVAVRVEIIAERRD